MFRILLFLFLIMGLLSCGSKKETPEVVGIATTISATYSTISGTGPVIADGTATSTVSIVLKNSSDEPVAGVTPRISLSGSGNSIGACSATDATGNSTCFVKSTKAEVKNLALDYPVSKSAADITFNAGPASKLCFQTQPGGGTAGTAWAQQPVIAVGDINCNVITTATDSISVSLSTGSGALAGVTTVSAVSGVATFSGLSLTNSADAKKITATAAGLTSVISNTFNISASTATQLAFVIQPSGGAAGLAWSTQPSVEVRDTYGNKITNSAAIISLSLTTGTGQLTGITTKAVSSGTASFTGLHANLVGSDKVLTASSSGLTSATSNAFTITPGAASKLAVLTQPGGGTSGSAWSTQPTFEIQDSSGNRVTSSTATVTVGLTTGAGVLAGTSAVNAISGVATFTDLSINVTGSDKSLLATSAGLTSVTTSVFTVTFGAATKLAFRTQPAGAAAGSSFATQPSIEIQDANGNLVSTSSASVVMSLTNGTGTLSGTTTISASGGIANFSGLSINLIGTNKILTATSSGLTSAASNTFSIVPATAAKLAFATQPGGGSASSIWSPQPVVQIQDAYGNLVSSAASNVTLTLSTGTGTLSGTTSVSAISGVASYNDLSIEIVGTKTLTATAAGLTAATSNSFSISPSIATQLVFGTQPGGGISNAVWAVQPVVEIHDASGNLVTTATQAITLNLNSGTGTLGGTKTVTAIGGVATFSNLTLNLAGTKNLQATGPSLASATSNSFSITSGLTVTSSSVAASQSSLFADGVSTSAITVSLVDSGGNPLVGKSVTLTSSRGASDIITTSPTTTDSFGQASFTVKSSTVGSSTYTATCTTDSVTLTTTPSVNFESTVTNLTQSLWSISPVTVAADGTSTATISVTTRNSSSSALSGKSVTVTSSRGASDTITTSPAITNASGVATFAIKSSTVGESTLTISVATDSLVLTSQGKVNFLNVAPYADWQARLAKSSSQSMGPGLNTGPTSVWKDLFSLGPNDGTLVNINYNTTSSGWCGNGTTTITSCSDGPYRLRLDGVNDFVNFGNSLGSFSSATYEVWARTLNANLKGKVIYSNGDPSDHGMNIRQAWDGTGYIEAKLGSNISYAGEVISDSPLAYFRLNETSGTAATATVGGTNGTYTGGYTLNQAGAMAENKSSVTLNGTTGYIAGTNAYEGTADQTVEAWVYPSSVTGTRPIISKQGTQGYSLELLAGKASFRLINSATTTHTVTGTTTLSLNTWHHIVGVRSSLTGKIYIYVNGIEEANAVVSGTPATTTTVFYIGRNGTNYFSGRIDEAAVYSSALSPARIAAHYDARAIPTCYSTAALPTTNWRHIVTTFDSTTTTLKLYINGTLQCTQAATGLTLAGSTYPLAAGAVVDGTFTAQSSTFWNGFLGDLRIYNTVLTPTQITNNFNATTGRYP